jgi:arabinan endo-1,5-alpha-L-arabinosidase
MSFCPGHGSRWPRWVCLFWLLLMRLAVVCLGQASGPFPLYGDYGIHDPGTLIKNGSSYFIYGDGQGISGLTSTDLRNWTDASAVFTNPPAWTTNDISGFTGYFWAPDIAYFNGRYNLYYACSQWGTINSAIGLVTSPSLTAPVWTDQGKVVESYYPATANTDTTACNCIDPSIMVNTNGTVWMSFGSYSAGILITQLDPATGKRLNTNSLTAYLVANNAPGGGWGSSEEGSCLYQRGGYYYLFVNFGGCCAGVDSTYNIRVGRSTSVTGPYYDQSGVCMTNGGGTMVLESTARFIGPGHAAIMNDHGTNWFTFHYYDGNANGAPELGLMQLNWTADGWPALTNDWSAFYTFNTDAREHLGLYNGTLQNNAAITNDASRGNVLNLDGVTNYVSLPNPVANCRTLACWTKWNGGAAWQRIFDFGADTTNYFFLTPLDNNGVMRFAITTNGGYGNEQIIDAPIALPTNQWCHVAVTLDGSTGLLYLNGNPVGTNNAMTIRPWQLLARNNYLGKSQYSGDPYFNGKMDSFRIFGRALSGTEIKDLAGAHPALAHRYSFTSNVRDSIGMAHGTLMGNATITNNALVLNGTTGTYVNLPGGLVSGSSAVSLEFWATFGTNGNWARVVDFGNIGNNAYGAFGYQYFGFSPHTDTHGQRMQLVADTTTTFGLAGTFDNRTLHVVCIVDPAGNYAAVYTNGVLENATNATWPSFASVSSAWSFIGRSLWSADAYLNAGIDELRLYDGRLTPQEIVTDYQSGPDALNWSPPVPTGLVATAISTNQINLVWNAVTNAASYNVKRSTTNGGSYTVIATGVTATNYNATGLAGTTTYYYVVSAVVSGFETPDSAQALATTLSPFAYSWGSPVSFAGLNAGQILTNFPGTVVVAALFAQNGGSSITVTLGGSSIVFAPANTSWAGLAGGSGYTTGASTNSTGNANFDSCLNAFYYDTGPHLITLSNLVVGRQYSVQLFALDDRNLSPAGSARTVNWQNPADTTNVSPTYSMADNKYIVLTCVASNAVQVIQENLLNSSYGNFNCLVLRAVMVPGTVTLGNLSQTYDGTAKSASATTTPTNLTANLTYNGSANAPTNAGSYTVIGTINDTNWRGSATNTLVISQGTGTVTLGNLSQTYDGTARSATATTAPTNLTVNITYNGSANAPTNAGSYTVIGRINNTNWQGSATNTLVISSASRPQMSLALTRTNLAVSWPYANTGYTLQSCTNLTLGNWLNVTSPTPQNVSNLWWELALPPATNARAMFYRLMK